MKSDFVETLIELLMTTSTMVNSMCGKMRSPQGCTRIARKWIMQSGDTNYANKPAEVYHEYEYMRLSRCRGMTGI